MATKRKNKSSPLSVSAGSFRRVPMRRYSSIRDLLFSTLITLTLTRPKGLLPRMISFIHAGHRLVTTGVKALVKITNPERHRDHFRALVKYFERTHGLELDESGINESRACFESYDPDIIIKDDYKKFGHFTTEHAEAQTPTNEAYDHTDYMKLNLAARMIRQAKDGEKWITLNRAAILCGGYVAAGRMEEEEVVRVLFREVCKRDVDNEDHAKQTIIAGIEKGKQMPIRDIIDEEKSAKREMLLNDGDMSFISSDDEDFRWIDDYSQGKIGDRTGHG